MRWTLEQAWDWYDARPWQCGVNYVPSSAVNSTEMWQRETFDLPTVDRELAWAAGVGLTVCRVFVQYLVWRDDPTGLVERLDAFLGVAARHGLTVQPVLLDDCAFAGREPYLGSQDEPLPGVHNSGWTPSPGHERVTDRSAWPGIEAYVTDLVRRFGRDPRVLLWDVYNEPGNAGMGLRSLPLVEAAFRWARAAAPDQPLTAGVWSCEFPKLDAVLIAGSDIVTFHEYDDLPALRAQVERLRTAGRPLMCTEWMRRGYGSHADSHLPFFQSEKIGALFWGLVCGRTQTYYPWGSQTGADEPQLWFHDLLDRSGAPHRPEEVELLRSMLVTG